MLKNTYAKLCDIVYYSGLLDTIYLNGKELNSDQIQMIISNKEIFQDLCHIDDVQYCFNTDEQYGWNEYHISNDWVPKTVHTEEEDDWYEYTEVNPYTAFTDEDLL